MSNTVSPADEEAYQPYDQFFLFGDSITEYSCGQDMGFGFHPALQNAYSRRLDVVNRGLAGYNSLHAIKVFPKCFPTTEQANVRLMTIWFGANDSSLPGFAQHVPKETYKQNLKRIIQHPLTIAQNPRIMIITPPPINEYQLAGFDAMKGNPHPTRTAAHAKEYVEAAREVGAELGVPVADVWSAFMATVEWREGQPLVGSRDLPSHEKFATLFTDGLHLAANGYRIVFDVIMKTVRENWPDQMPDKLPYVFPAWAFAPK
ncbi:GDSL Lipase/Acylhydrolase family protein [Aspergillus heteromorphus CBS 117.55]|uniref:GDSL Lipase/Acylhydrolase family protein n=1 Tax=Aspergillus heteromorphus CBS 117.55 TaxID=1448321 RepID=A0A317V3F6_9EURO|nr:GDSL Lipase/Acylhydrolase family protein [Aspergillus heteromorphus CBS 117.55]PWY68615.1 GDSL Lipase/Acylhydrolase family protein [Aspergillus heteromorphus CBS 117.55]